MKLRTLIRDRNHHLCWHASRTGRRCLRPASEHHADEPFGHPYVAPPPLPVGDDREARRIAREATKHMRLNWEVPL